MKNWILFFALVIGIQAIGQDSTATSNPVNYRNYSTFPAFPLLKIDSSRFNSVSAVVKGRPMVVIYFSPTCSHCQHQAEEITGRMKDFEKVQFLMVSSYAIDDIKQYIASYALDHFPNITVAYDPSFSMGRFFELKSLPGIFVYDKKGKLKSHFDTNVHADELLKAIEQ